MIKFFPISKKAAKLTSADKLKAEPTSNRISCPNQCLCIDSLTGSESNSQSNQSFIESNSFEVNCTNIIKDLESILNTISIKTTHL